MNYVLRVVVHENAWQRQLEDIVSLCHYANIEEVFLKEECHQILMSTFPLEKQKRMAEIYQKMAKRFRQEGIHFSINLATVVGHCDAKLSEEMTLPYTKFVGESLVPNHSTYCLLDTGWQKFIQQMVSLYAESDPEIIMVDDDFRSLNHSGYLGCFCPLHVAKASEACGVPLTAQSLRDHVLGNSRLDRKVRSAWRKINFEGQLQAARAIEEAVHAVNPRIRVGLMNSGEPNHSVQGRDIQLLIKTLAGEENRPVSRPLGGAYADCLHQELVEIHHGMALSMAQLEDVEIISEVENWPHTRYTKSIRITELQMKLHALAGADKISMNIFDFMGTPYSQEPGFMDSIRDMKVELNKIEALRKGKKAQGVGMLWHKDCAQTQVNRTHTAQDLIPDRRADSLFTMLGVPVAFTPQKVNFLTESVAENLSDEEILNLLRGGLILEATGFACLTRRGFGEYLGCYSEGLLSEVSCEKLTDPEFCGSFTGNLVPTDWLRQGLKNVEIPLLTALPGARELTEILDVEYRRLGGGACIFENSLGGRVAVLPEYICPWTYSYRSRAYLLRKVVEYLEKGNADFTLEEGTNVAPFYYTDHQEGLLALLNTGLDSESVTVRTAHSLLDGEQNVANESLTLQPLELRFLTLKKEN